MSEQAAAAVAAEVVSQEVQGEVNAETTASPANDDFGVRFAALARQEKHLQQEKAKLKELESRYSSYQDLESQVKTKPSVLLEKYGISLDDLIADQYNINREISPEERLQKKLDELESRFASKEEQEAKARKEEEEALRKSQEESEAAAIAAHQDKIAAFIEENVDQYELIKILEQQELVWEITEAQFNKDGKLLTIEEASKLAENYLIDQAKLILGAAKVKQLLEPKAKQKETPPALFETTEVDSRESHPSSRTLTQSFVSSNSSNRNPSPEHKLSVEESKKRAAAMLQAALNNKK